MAVLCQQFKKRHAAAVELYQQAFRAKPPTEDDSAAGHRYNAACSAVLAGTGQSEDAGKLPTDAKAALRQQARDWLHAELERDGRLLRKGDVATAMAVELRLAHWQTDPDLTAVRDAKALAALPTDEAKEWRKLWAHATKLLEDVRGRFMERRAQGELTEKVKVGPHEWRMIGGRTYVLNLESTAFDAFLKLYAPDGKLLGENDDIVPGVNRNAG